MSLPSRRKFTTMQLLRYPLVFGGILTCLATAFIYRESFFGDLEEERRKMFIHDDQENRELFRKNIIEVNKARMERDSL